MEASPPSPDNNEHINVTYDLQDFQTSIFVCLVGILLIVLFIQISKRVVTWLRHEVAVDHLDLELVQIANYQLENSDWPDEAMVLNNVWVMEIFNGFMVYLAERQVSGLTPEFLEQALPCSANMFFISVA
ncbi:hypothetical protein PVK06_000683 [Gossypium arboreum]|uniref:Uncharacterized protein n=1 Tax=Gossypium arboreum TaxID=29729 RepID=A0ABR0QZ04_GOSAR|nr:hypothetical protein PVK06_000683 [Gossypium arboreum]